MITLPGPGGTEIGEPAAGVKKDCCGSALVALPDWHEVTARIVANSIEYFTTGSFQALDVREIIFVPAGFVTFVNHLDSLQLCA